MKLRYSLIAPLFASFSLFALAGCSSKSSTAMPSETAAPTQAQTQEQAKSAVPAETESAAVSDIQLADLITRIAFAGNICIVTGFQIPV